MINWFQKIKWHFSDRAFLISTGIGVLLLAGSFFLNFYAGMYATEKASNPVTDIVLSNIRVYDVDAIFIYGPVFLWSFVALLCFIEPKRLPFVLKSLALFIIIRSIFISLTHIGPFPTQIITSGGMVVEKFVFGGDLFFSGHTGAPFLIALIFWNNSKYLKWFFFVTSVIFGVVVLMGHYHYSIDVLAAFFITYTIFNISKYFFKKDRELFLK